VNVFAGLILGLIPVAASPLPDLLLVADKSDDTVRIVDARSGDERAMIEPDGGHAWVTSTNTNAVCRIDLETFAVTASLVVGAQPDAIAGRFAGWR
jgi:YVTN family beta-propeller protein